MQQEDQTMHLGLRHVVVMDAVSEGGVRRYSHYTARGNLEARGKGGERL